MYRCDRCSTLSLVGEDCYRLVTETRPRFYKQKIKIKKDDEEIEKLKESKGWEIKKEEKLCQTCYMTLKEIHGNTLR